MSENEKKERGMAAAATKYGGVLEFCRTVALAHAKENGGRCSIEDVRRATKMYALPWGKNWEGKVFSGKHWEYHSMVKTTHEGGHSRRVIMWHLLFIPESPRTTHVPVKQMELL